MGKIMPETKEKNICNWNWIIRTIKFNQERRRLIEHFKEKEDKIWLTILERMDVPYLNWKYIFELASMPAEFYVPGFSIHGRELKSFVCEVGDLSEIFFDMLYVVGFTDEKIPQKIRYLMEIIK